MTPKDWEARNYRDRDGRRATVLDWSDPVEKLAMLLRAFTYMTSADAAGMVTGEKGRAELAKTWRFMQAVDRQVWRRRAATALMVLADDVALGSDARQADGAMR
jgi:hypothetical protein